MRFAVPVALAFLWASGLSGQEPPPVPKTNIDPQVKLLPTPALGVAVAAADLEQIASGKDVLTAAAEQPFVRYLFVQDPSEEQWRSAVYAHALIHQGSANELAAARPVPLPLAGPLAGKAPPGTVLRLNLRRLVKAGDDAALQRLVEDWEQFRFDGYFAKLLTKDVLANIDLKAFEVVPKVRVVLFQTLFDESLPGVTVENGQSWKGRYVRKKVFKEIPLTEIKAADVVTLDAAHVGAEHARLKLALGTEAPIVDSRYFVFRALSTIRKAPDDKGDGGVFGAVFGGLYYRLSGIQAVVDAKKGDQTDEDAIFAKFGGIKIESKKNGRAFDQFFAELGSDSRVACRISKVTGRKRVVIWAPTLGSQRKNGALLYTIDIAQEDVDSRRNPFRNLIEPQGVAREGFVVKSNGLPLGFLIKEDDRSLQDEAPIQVVTDRTIPDPHPPRLQAMISCVSCHGGFDWWRPVPNDVLKIALRTDILGDTARRNAALADTNRELRRLYGGEFEPDFVALRNDHAAAVLLATGPWKAAASRAQANVAGVAAAALTRVYHDWAYADVTPRLALRELGFDVPEELALRYFQLLLPPDRRSAVAGVLPDAVFPEDETVAALRAGVAVSRTDYILAYSFMADRVQDTLAELSRLQAAAPKREIKGGGGDRYVVRPRPPRY